MSDPIPTQLSVLTGSRAWSATPDNDSSIRAIFLEPGGTGSVVHSYGQTIHTTIDFRFEIISPGVMSFDDFETPQRQRRPPFVPTDDNRSKEIGFSLTAGEWIIREDVTGFVFRFSWTLDFAEPPYPDGLTFPHTVPTTFYGYREQIGDRNMVLP